MSLLRRLDAHVCVYVLAPLLARSAADEREMESWPEVGQWELHGPGVSNLATAHDINDTLGASTTSTFEAPTYRRSPVVNDNQIRLPGDATNREDGVVDIGGSLGVTVTSDEAKVISGSVLGRTVGYDDVQQQQQTGNTITAAVPVVGDMVSKHDDVGGQQHRPRRQSSVPESARDAMISKHTANTLGANLKRSGKGRSPSVGLASGAMGGPTGFVVMRATASANRVITGGDVSFRAQTCKVDPARESSPRDFSSTLTEEPKVCCSTRRPPSSGTAEASAPYRGVNSMLSESNRVEEVSYPTTSLIVGNTEGNLAEISSNYEASEPARYPDASSLSSALYMEHPSHPGSGSLLISDEQRAMGLLRSLTTARGDAVVKGEDGTFRRVYLTRKDGEFRGSSARQDSSGSITGILTRRGEEIPLSAPAYHASAPPETMWSSTGVAADVTNIGEVSEDSIDAMISAATAKMRERRLGVVHLARAIEEPAPQSSVQQAKIRDGSVDRGSATANGVGDEPPPPPSVTVQTDILTLTEKDAPRCDELKSASRGRTARKGVTEYNERGITSSRIKTPGTCCIQDGSAESAAVASEDTDDARDSADSAAHRTGRRGRRGRRGRSRSPRTSRSRSRTKSPAALPGTSPTRHRKYNKKGSLGPDTPEDCARPASQSKEIHERAKGRAEVKLIPEKGTTGNSKPGGKMNKRQRGLPTEQSATSAAPTLGSRTGAQKSKISGNNELGSARNNRVVSRSPSPRSPAVCDTPRKDVSSPEKVKDRRGTPSPMKVKDRSAGSSRRRKRKPDHRTTAPCYAVVAATQDDVEDIHVRAGPPAENHAPVIDSKPEQKVPAERKKNSKRTAEQVITAEHVPPDPAEAESMLGILANLSLELKRRLRRDKRRCTAAAEGRGGVGESAGHGGRSGCKILYAQPVADQNYASTDSAAAAAAATSTAADNDDTQGGIVGECRLLEDRVLALEAAVTLPGTCSQSGVVQPTGTVSSSVNVTPLGNHLSSAIHPQNFPLDASR